MNAHCIHRRRGHVFSSGLALAFLGVAFAAAQSPTAPVTASGLIQRFDAGLTFTSGDYGLGEDTEVWVAPFTYTHESERWTLRATLPWVVISGPASVIAGGGTGVGGPQRPTTTSEYGLGDSSLGLSYKFNPGFDGWSVDGTARVKFPTGDDERGIGTGEMDYFTQLDFYRSFVNLTPFATVGYRILGDGRYELDDGFYASIGSLFRLGMDRNLAVALDWRERLVASEDDALEGSVRLINQHSARWSSLIGALAGFNDASMDYGLTGSLTYTF